MKKGISTNKITVSTQLIILGVPYAIGGLYLYHTCILPNR